MSTPHEIPAAAGTLTFCLQAPTLQELGEQLAALLAEQLTPDHELDLTYSSMQTGWQESPGFGQAFAGVHVGRTPQTTLFFEYRFTRGSATCSAKRTASRGSVT
jgi:hypothetical protein